LHERLHAPAADATRLAAPDSRGILDTPPRAGVVREPHGGVRHWQRQRHVAMSPTPIPHALDPFFAAHRAEAAPCHFYQMLVKEIP